MNNWGETEMPPKWRLDVYKKSNIKIDVIVLEEEDYIEHIR